MVLVAAVLHSLVDESTWKFNPFPGFPFLGGRIFLDRPRVGRVPECAASGYFDCGKSDSEIHVQLYLTVATTIICVKYFLVVES
jgi:hypothetical protein